MLPNWVFANFSPQIETALANIVILCKNKTYEEMFLDNKNEMLNILLIYLLSGFHNDIYLDINVSYPD